MAFNRTTEDTLLRLKQNFPSLANKIFAKTVLQPFDGSQKNNLYALPVERVSHGAQHASRMALYIPLLVNFFRKLGYPREIVELTESQITLLQYVALFYDVTRQADFTKDPKVAADLFIRFLKKKGITDPAAYEFTQYFTPGKKDIFDVLIQGADSLDFIRRAKQYELEKNPLFSMINASDRQSFVDFVVAIRSWIASQSDLKSACSLTISGTEVVPAIPATLDPHKPSLKQAYEHAPNIIGEMTAELVHHPLLKEYLDLGNGHPNQNHQPAAVLTPVPVAINQDPAAPTPSLLIPHLEAASLIRKTDLAGFTRNTLIFPSEDMAQECLEGIQRLVKNRIPDIQHVFIYPEERTFRFILTGKEWTALYDAIREAAPTLKPPATYFIKSLRADENCYYHRFVDEIVLGKKFPKRKGEKGKLTVTGSGIYARDPGAPDLAKFPLKTPQYTAQEKAGFTNAQSTSIGMPDLNPEVFGFDARKDLLGGIIVEEKNAVDEKNVLLSRRLFIYDGGTVDRPTDFKKEAEAIQYADLLQNKKLFGEDKYEEFKEEVRKHPDQYSEPLIRFKWAMDSTCKYFIGNDNLRSCLLTKQYADTLLSELQKAGQCPPGYQIPICFYLPKDQKSMFKQYTQEEYLLDRLNARRIFHDSKLRYKHYNKNEYEFLLALLPDEIHQALSEKVKDDIPLAIHLLANGRGHLYRFLTEKSTFNLKAALDVITTNPDHHQILNNVLKHAALTGHLEVIKLIAPSIGNINPESYANLIQELLNRNLIEIAHALLSSLDPDNYDKFKKYVDKPFLTAACNGLVNILNWFLLREIHPDIKTWESGAKALALASYHNHVDVMELLLKNGVSLYTRNKEGKTVLEIAIGQGNKDAVQLLLRTAAARGEDNFVNDAFEDCGNSPLIQAIYHPRWELTEIVELLLKEGAKIEEKNVAGETALFAAISKGRIEIIKILLKNNVDIHARNANGNTAFFEAVSCGHIEVVRLLLQHDAKLEEKNRNGETSLFAAISNGHVKVARLLLQHGANLEAQNDQGKTPLFIAVSHNNRKIIKLLLENNANINAKDVDGDTVLHHAAVGEPDMVRFLLEKNAEIDARNNSGNTPLHKAMHHVLHDDHDETPRSIFMLFANGADINAKNVRGLTPRILAKEINRYSKNFHSLQGLVDIQKLWHQAAAQFDAHNLSISQQLSRLFHCYASSTFDWRHHKELARKISDKLGHEKRKDWDLSRCKAYIKDQTSNLKFSNRYNPTGTFASLLNIISMQKMQDMQMTRPAANKVMQDMKAAKPLGVERPMTTGFLGKDWASVHMETLINLFDKLSGPFTRITDQHLSEIRELVSKGALLTKPGKHRKTAMECAIDLDESLFSSSKDWRCVNAILDAAIEAGRLDIAAYNLALERAVRANRIDVVERLLKAGADADHIIEKPAQDAGNTCLHLAVKNNNHDMVELLLQYGANPAVHGKNGDTCLHVAVDHNHPRMVTLLLEKGGAHLSYIINDKHRTPLETAEQRSFMLGKCLKAIKDHNATIKVQQQEISQQPLVLNRISAH